MTQNGQIRTSNKVFAAVSCRALVDALDIAVLACWSAEILLTGFPFECYNQRLWFRFHSPNYIEYKTLLTDRVDAPLVFVSRVLDFMSDIADVSD